MSNNRQSPQTAGIQTGAGQNDLLVDVLTSAHVPGFEVKKMSDNVTVYMVGVLKKNLHYRREIEVREWLGGAARPDYE